MNLDQCSRRKLAYDVRHTTHWQTFADYLFRPYFVKGCAIGCAFSGLIVIFSLSLYFRLRHINKKKGEMYGSVADDQQLDVTTLGDSHPAFRFLT